jgi:zinc transporter ZupT
VRGAWWRTAALTAFVTGVALLLGPLLGTLLLFGTNASFDVVNVVSDLVYVVALPFAAVATTYLYFELSARSAESGGRAASRT